MNQVTQQTAASSEESASAAAELASQAQEMQGMVARFRLTSATSESRVRHGETPPRRILTSEATGREVAGSQKSDGHREKPAISPRDLEAMIPFHDEENSTVLQDF
jgi:hypothetical protein